MSTSNFILKNSITALGLFYINNSLCTILSNTRTGIKTIGFFCPQHPILRPKSAISTPKPAPSQQSLFSLAPFWRTRERTAWVEKDLCWTCATFDIRFQTLGTWAQLWPSVCQSDGFSHSQISLISLIDSSRSSGCGDFKCLTRFSQSEPMNCTSLYIHWLQVMIGLLADLSVFRLTRATTLVIGFTTLNWSSDRRTSTWLMSDLTKSHL